MPVIAGLAHDPNLYSFTAMGKKEYRGYLAQFLKSAAQHHVLVIDDMGYISKQLKDNLLEVSGKWPEVSFLAQECLKRQHTVVSSSKTKLVADLVAPWIDGSSPEENGSLATLSLAGETCVDGVVVSEKTEEIADCAKLAAPERDKVRRLFEVESLAMNAGGSLYGEPRTEAEKKWFGPILRWGEHVALVDKQIGPAFNGSNREGSNWNNFRLTVFWLYRLWKKYAVVPCRCFEILTHPARDETGRMDEPDYNVANSIWQEFGSHDDMRVTIIKESRAEREKRIGGDVTHPRYLLTMPMEFVMSVDRGFDFLQEIQQQGQDPIVAHACNVALLPTIPPDLSVVLKLRNSGVTFPQKGTR